MFVGLTPKVRVFFRSTIFDILSITHQEKEVWPGGIQPMLLPKSSCVCKPGLRSVGLRVCLSNVPFLAFFGLMRTQKECGHIEVIKTFP